MAIQCSRCIFHQNDVISGRFKVVRMLGAGSFGCVYLVTDNTGGYYALKLLKLWEIPGDERDNFLRRFDIEFETGQIHSNYLVKSFTKGSVEGNPYIVMEYCPEGDLLNVAEHREIDFIKIAKDVLYGLRDLHERGKVHRDLKPENVLMRKDGTAALTDFGISGDQNNRITQRGIFGIPQQRFGTFAYMPPEQVNPKRGNATVLPTTDIFSFGVMMYQLLTFELPFGDLQSDRDLPLYIKRVRNGEWNRSLLKKIPNSRMWSRLIERCLEPDFRNRLQCVDDALTLLPHSSSNPYRPVNSNSLKNRSVIKNGVLLRIMQGEEYNKEYKLSSLLDENRNIITIGRECEDVYNTIAIKDTINIYISRCHCTLEFDQDRREWVIRDGQWRINCPVGLRFKSIFPCTSCTALCSKCGGNHKHSWRNSTNGTFVNSTEVGRDGMIIRIGDVISVGDVKLRVEGY